MSTTDQATASNDRPNVVLLTAHDLGRHLGCYGVETVETPNLDALADRGVRFENACASSPVCSPSRGSLLTGRYPQSNGLLGLTHPPWWWRLDGDEETLPELLGDAGYETHLCGLQHVAPEPARLDFDDVRSEEHDAEETVDAAAEVFERAGATGDRPFYAQIGFFEAHRPLDHGTYTADGVAVPPHLEATEELRSDLAAYQATVNYLDERVGEVLDALDANGLREETVVVFAADHGIPYPGAKWWCRDAGVGVALLADGPGPAFDGRDTVEAMASNVDVLPTLFDVLDLSVPDRVEGVSFRDYLAGESETPPREAAFTQYTDEGKEARGVVTREYTLIRNFGAGRTVQYPTAAAPTDREGETVWEPRPFAQLYDRREDPHELDDVAAGNGDVVADLSAEVLGWMADVGDPLLQGRIPYPYRERATRDLLTTGARRE